MTINAAGQSRVFLIDSGITATITGVTIEGGSTTGNGGGVYNAGSLTLTDCTITGNTASGGGGGVWNQGTAVLVDSTIAGNLAGGGGGGLRGEGATTTLTACTVTDNSADAHGGGLFDSGSTTTLTDTIVAGNFASSSDPDVDDTSIVSTSSYNLIGIGTGITGITNGTNGNQVGTASSPIDPLLSALGSYGGATETIALLPGGPAIGAGEAVATLKNAVASTTSTTITLASGSGLAASGLPALASGDYFVIEVDTEQMSVTALTLNANGTSTLSVVRGANGTTAAKHAANASVVLGDQRGRWSRLAPGHRCLPVVGVRDLRQLWQRPGGK